MPVINATKKYVIMAGGTGGHVNPGIAVAKELKKQGHEVYWMGTSSGIEARLVPEQQIDFYTINVKSLRGKGVFRTFLMPFILLKAIFQAYFVLQKLKPQAVISMGGFVAGPGGIAAWLLGIDLYVHEQNAVAGLTNRWLAKFAKKVFVAFSPTQKLAVSKDKILETGNPVRTEIISIPAPENRAIGSHERLRILVVGGSLGAQAINQVMPQALSLLPDDKKPEVWHQTGAKHFAETQKHYLDRKLNVKLVEYIDDMKKAYIFADMVICRAGALTVSELAAVGIASILIPFPHAVDDHQTKNAQILTKAGAAMVVNQLDLTPERLAELILRYIDHPEACLEMALCARTLAKTNATQQVVAACQ